MFWIFGVLVSLLLGVQVFGNNVTVLTEANFDSIVDRSDYNVKWFVMFWSSSCFVCNIFKPTWEQFAKELNDSSIRLGSIRGDDNYDLTEKFKVNGYPTLLYFIEGQGYEFIGKPRTLENLLAFVKEGYFFEPEYNITFVPAQWRPNPKMIDLKTETIGHYVNRSDLDTKWLILFYSPGCHGCVLFKPTWNDFAQQLSLTKIKLGNVRGDENYDLLQAFKIEYFPSLIFIADGKVFEFTDDKKIPALNAFVAGGYKTAKVKNVTFYPTPIKKPDPSPHQDDRCPTNKSAEGSPIFNLRLFYIVIAILFCVCFPAMTQIIKETSRPKVDDKVALEESELSYVMLVNRPA